MKPLATIRITITLCGALLIGASLSDFPAAAQRNVARERPPASMLVYPNGLVLDDKGDLYVADVGTHRILKLDRQGRMRVIAGTGEGGFSGDNGPAAQARLFAPHDLALDSESNLWIADTYNHRLRRINRQGVITTVAGNGKAEYSGGNGPALQASLNNPQGIAIDRAGAILIADTYNNVVRRIDPNGTIMTFAGSEPGFGGDGGPANKAQLNLPMAVAVAPDGSVYISDAGNSRIRRVTADGKIQTVVGYGPAQDTYGAGFAGDGGPAEKGKIFSATDLEFDATGNLYIADSGNNRIRIVREGTITTIAGSGTQGFSGDGKPALAAELNTPQKIAIAKDGSIFIADRANHRVRKVDTRKLINTIAGAGKSTGMMFDPAIQK